MAWLVTLTAKDEDTGENGSHTATLPGDSYLDLLYPRTDDVPKWKVLSRMLERGVIIRVAIDYRKGE